MRKTGILVGVGIVMGCLALFLTLKGNPPNMGVCVACFLRDTAGGLKLQTAAPVQYMRPEIFGFAIGAFFSALLVKRFMPRAGSAPMIRFSLGFFMMIGCLVFLGCPIRMILRIGAGDLNAVIGLAGLAVGIVIGVFFLKRHFSLPNSHAQSTAEGLIFPLLSLLVLGAMFLVPKLFAQSSVGPGSMHAPFIYSLIGGLVIGLLVERTRFCSIGFISHILLFKQWSMFFGVLALLITVFIGNLYFGSFKLGFDLQPIAHTDNLWNFLSLVLVGITGVFLGGCPLRQIVKAGHADGDGAVTVIGMLVGAAIAHNFGLASTAQNAANLGGATFGGKIVVVIGLSFVIVLGIYQCFRIKSATLSHHS